LKIGLKYGLMRKQLISPDVFIFLISSTIIKKHPQRCFFHFGCGRGIRTPDLWVMSPTSYRTAPSRAANQLISFSLKMVPETGIEPVRDIIPQDFKSCASANSATPTYPFGYANETHFCATSSL
jgi:hypothetical protein